MVRKAWASRIPSGETIGFTKVMTSEDKQMVDTASSRLTIVMDHVGLTDGRRLPSSHGSVVTAVAQTAAESALAKQQAAADAMRRLEQASKDPASRTRCAGTRVPKGSQHQEKGKGKRARDAHGR